MVLRWTAEGLAPGTRLVVRPFLSGRDVHALHVENPAFRFDAEVAVDRAEQPEVRRLAQSIVNAQTAEITVLQDHLDERGGPVDL